MLAGLCIVVLTIVYCCRACLDSRHCPNCGLASVRIIVLFGAALAAGSATLDLVHCYLVAMIRWGLTQ